ncbi:MAG: Ribosomal RNA small subunit methyltransferase A [uncultured bacterium]|nr:MAG: Ribosomal RNA small subunit methyltransferase A [uncultured bacterium]
MTKLGQHFLVDPHVLHDMAALVKRHGSRDTILEIGPGKGVLTKQLVKLARRVIAIEIDRNLSSNLDPLVKHHPNLEIVYADILKCNLVELGLRSGEYSIASNLPYHITGVVLRRFLTQQPYPSHMALLIQKEVAQRITAKPGDLSILGLSVQAFSQPRVVRTVSKTAFRPQPEVESAIVSLEHIRQSTPLAVEQEKKFFWLVKVGFAQKRKLLSSNIKNGHIPIEVVQQAYQELGLPKTARAQELSLHQWYQLVDKLDKFIV